MLDFAAENPIFTAMIVWFLAEAAVRIVRRVVARRRRMTERADGDQGPD